MKNLLLLLLAVVFLAACGSPLPKEPVYTMDLPDLPNSLPALEKYIQEKEAHAPTREDNQAHISWYKGEIQKREYAIVYLHGFGGSYRDGYPLNKQVADSIGANIYMGRWSGHGLKPPHSLANFSPETAWADAKESLMIGEKLGDKVIIMSTSTGGTLALMLAMNFPERVHALINISPNIEDDVEGAFMLNSPVGEPLSKIVALGDTKKIRHDDPRANQYWDTAYPAEALVQLQTLVGTTMEEEYFSKVQCPVLTLYYHKNMFNEDERVEVDEFPELHQHISTPDSLHKLVALPDPETHFIGSDIMSKDYSSARDSILDFFEHVIKVRPNVQNH